MTAFSIVGDLLLRTGSFITDTGRAEKSLRSLKKETLDTFAVFKASFAGGLAVGAVTELTRQLATIPSVLGDIVREAGHFQDVSERIGAAADDVAGFAVALHVAGGDVNQLADFSVRLTKALSKTADGSSDTAKALAAIGIPLEQFRKLNPVQQIEELAKALDSFASGPEQTAILEGLVKGGSQLLPFLKELQAEGGRQNILTAQQIKLADDYADRQARSSAQLKAYAQIAATEALPAITALQNVFVGLVKELINANGASNALSGSSMIAEWAKEAALFVAAFVDSLRGAVLDIKLFVATSEKEIAELVLIYKRGKDLLERFGSLNFSNVQGGVDQALQERNAAVAKANDALAERLKFDTNKVQDLVKKQFAAATFTGERFNASTDPRSTTFGQPLKPKINVPTFGGGSKDDPAKKLLENQLKALDAIIKKEQDLLQTRNRFLDIFNAQGLVSIKDYYDAQLTIIESATTAELAAIDKQIAATTKARDNATKKTDRAEFQGKLDEQIVARAKLEQESGAKAIEISIKRAEAERQYQEQVKSTSANLLELQGNLSAAAAIRFDQQNLQLFNHAVAEGDDKLLALLKALRDATILQADFTKAANDSAREFDKLSNIEEQAAINRLAGKTNELQSLKEIGDARKAQIPILEAEVKALEAIARASGQPAQVQQAEQARLALEKLKATIDPIGDKFRDVFQGSATDALTDFIDHTKSASDAFKEFADSVVQQISRIVAQNLAESLFGKGGLDLGGAIGGLFGGAGAAKSPAGGSGGGSGILDTFFSGIASFFGGGKAGGGDVIAGRSYQVGEHGPERFVPRTNGSIVPASMNGASKPQRPINVSIGVQGQVDTRTQSQVAMEAGRAVQRVMSRGDA